MSTASSARPVVMFDIDGTLVDSNYLHIQAWSEALQAVGHPVDSARIHRAIGMGSSPLLESLLDEAKDDVGDQAKEEHTRRYRQLTSRLRTFTHAPELLAELKSRGLQVVLATSAPEQELEALLETLDADDAIAFATSGEDVETAKPEPDLLQVALDRAGVDAADAFMIGDSVWDALAAERAGVRFIGVLTGGTTAADLTEAGAVAVYESVAELLDQLDSSPLAGLAVS